MYAIVKTGGKQYHVEPGRWLLVERLPVDDGATVSLEPLLYVDGAEVVDGDGLQNVNVQARVLGHERGPKLRIVKFKPKRGYRRRNGHRQELTRIEVTSVTLGSGHGTQAALAPATPSEAPAAPAIPAEAPAAPAIPAEAPAAPAIPAEAPAATAIPAEAPAAVAIPAEAPAAVAIPAEAPAPTAPDPVLVDPPTEEASDGT